MLYLVFVVIFQMFFFRGSFEQTFFCFFLNQFLILLKLIILPVNL